jgi:Protein of unknown function (DUF3306)
VSEHGFFRRWSERKRTAGTTAPTEAATEKENSTVHAPFDAKVPEKAHGMATSPAAVLAADSHAVPVLPDTATLTPSSDFVPFFQPNVAPEIRNRAVKALFADPHFNVMDGLDTYIEDFTENAPIPATWVEKLARLEAEKRQREATQPADSAHLETAPVEPLQPERIATRDVPETHPQAPPPALT